MKVIIVEDDLIVADHLKMMLKRHDVNVMATLDNVNEAKISANLHQPDLIFVDIRLEGEESGIDLGNHLSKINIPFIYVTANNEVSTMRLATQSKPMAYVTKPYKENDIIAMLEIFKSKFQQTFTVKTSHGKKSILIADILYTEANGSYTDIVTVDKKYTERISLSQLEEVLSSDFIRIHRSFIINKNKIEHYTASTIFINQKEISISRVYKSNIEHLLK